MFQKLKAWWNGEDVEVKIITSKYEVLMLDSNKTLVQLSDNSRSWVKGYLGEPGEKITVNTWDLRKY